MGQKPRNTALQQQWLVHLNLADIRKPPRLRPGGRRRSCSQSSAEHFSSVLNLCRSAIAAWSSRQAGIAHSARQEARRYRLRRAACSGVYK
jgi:hypothetical protein